MRAKTATAIRRELAQLLHCPLCDQPLSEDEITVGAEGHDELARIWCEHCRAKHQAPPFLMFFAVLSGSAQSGAQAAALAAGSRCPHCGEQAASAGVLGITVVESHYWIALQCLDEGCGVRFYTQCDQRASAAVSADEVLNAHEALREVTSLAELFAEGLPAVGTPGPRSPAAGDDGACRCDEAVYWAQVNGATVDPTLCPRHPLPPQHC